MRLAIRQRQQPSAHNLDALYIFVVSEISQPRPPLLGDHASGVVREPCEHRDVVPCANPMAAQLDSPCCGRTHFRREVLGDVENLHLLLVVAQLERALVAQRDDALDPAALIALPKLSVLGKKAQPSKLVHDA